MNSSVSIVSPASSGQARAFREVALRAGYVRSTWFLIFANLLAVVWGAFVRASKSGDGCGAHWPACNGEILPVEPSIKTLIEFTHRGMVGILLILTVVLVVRAFLLFPKKHAVRRGMSLTLFFTLTEGGIGAALVLFGLVGTNDSAVRAIVLAAHLVNTFLLLASLAFASWGARESVGQEESPRLQLREQGGVLWLVGIGLFLTLWVSVSGVVAALGDQLKPIDSLGHAISMSMAPTAHFLDRLRLLHPTVAIATTIVIILMTTLTPRLRPGSSVAMWARFALTAFCFQIGFGLMNAWMKAPVWMQLVHLMIADGIWLSLIFMSCCALAVGAPRAALEPSAENVKVAGPESVSAEPLPSLIPVKATWKDYAMLTKPRVISLLIVTTWTAMVMAQRGWPGFMPMLLTGIGFYMAAGGAHAINMVIDRDIDKRTERTAKRGVASGRISVRNALIFASVLCVGSFLILWLGVNLLSALMAMSGLAFYVIVYTLLLKRRTWSNIVIGGAAGAFPPLVGWAAVANDLAPLAWLLFGIIFLWTPVHFWALAILLKDDYAKNGIPMLPVVKGERATAWQIVWYAILTMLISLSPILLRDGGLPSANWIYAVVAVALNGILIWRSILLYRDPVRNRASWLFHYSMLYLFLLFLALAVDRVIVRSA